MQYITRYYVPVCTFWAQCQSFRYDSCHCGGLETCPLCKGSDVCGRVAESDFQRYYHQPNAPKYFSAEIYKSYLYDYIAFALFTILIVVLLCLSI